MTTPPTSRAAQKQRDQVSLAVLEAIGGAANVTQAWHCITRLRFEVRDKSAVDLDAIRRAGVAGAQFSGDQLQVIVGTDVAAQFRSLSQHLSDDTASPADPAEPATPSGSARFSPRRLVNLLFETLSGIFSPILPAIVGAGLLKGLVALATQLGWLPVDGGPYQVLSVIADGAFYFLPFLVAASSAKRFGVDMSLALSVPAALLYPTIVSGAAAAADTGVAGLDLFGLTVPFVNYANAVIPPILGVYALGWIHRLIDRVTPAAIKIVVTPLLTLLIAIPLTLIVLAPLGDYLGVYVSEGALWLFERGGFVAGILLGGLMPLVVITGMHYAFFPTTLQSLATRGYDVILLPFNLVANLATAGATIAVAIRHKQLRALALSTAFPAFLGITEPAIYGITIRLKKPFAFTIVGGALGGAYAGLIGLKSFGFAVPGLASLPLYVNSEYAANIVHALVSIAISFTVAFVLTLLFCAPDKAPSDPGGSTQAPAVPAAVAVSREIGSPLSGRVIALTDVPDPTFAQQLLGPGIAIVPRDGVVTAPFEATVDVLPATGHAIALRSEDGVELLIHIGLDTVGLPAGGFTALVAEGDRVHAGQELIRFDPATITAAGLSPITPIVVTNAALVGDVQALPVSASASVAAGAPILRIAHDPSLPKS